MNATNSIFISNTQNNQSSNSFNTNTLSSGLKSRSKKHSEDYYSFKSDMKMVANDARDLQTFPKRFLPENGTLNSMSKLDKQSSSNSNPQLTASQKNLTKKILERIESEQNHLNIQDEDKSADFQEVSENKSLTEMEEDILNTISNKHSSSHGPEKNEETSNISESLKEEEKNEDKVLKKNVTFSNRISRAKTYDIKMDDNNSNSKSRSERTPKEGSNNKEINIPNEEKKKMKSPERIYDILKHKKNEDEKGADKIFKNIAVMMLVNHFVRQIKIKSGHFGKLGHRQIKILNDLCTPQKLGLEKNQELEHTNILVRMIRQNQLIQKTLKKTNFFKKWTGSHFIHYQN